MTNNNNVMYEAAKRFPSLQQFRPEFWLDKCNTQTDHIILSCKILNRVERVYTAREWPNSDYDTVVHWEKKNLSVDYLTHTHACGRYVPSWVGIYKLEKK